VTLRLHVDSYLNVDFCLALFTATVHVKMPIAKTPVSATLEGAGQSVSWADQMDDLEASEITADNLPEPRETVNGDTRTVVSYRVDEGGKIKKVTQVYQEVRQQVPKAIARRRVCLHNTMSTIFYTNLEYIIVRVMCLSRFRAIW
jgi:hypothetical protein